jgi:hypothetical protein
VPVPAYPTLQAALDRLGGGGAGPCRYLGDELADGGRDGHGIAFDPG